MFNQSCILCTQPSATILCQTCLADCIQVVKDCPSANHPVLVDIQNHANTDFLNILHWYRWPLDELIQLIKFKQRPQFCQLVSHWFVNYALHQSQLPDAIIAMPTGHWKQLIRGYNPPQILAAELSTRLGVTLLNDTLKVKSSFIEQRKLSRQKRLSREKQFVAKALPKHIQHIAIVDDIVTTGSTLKMAVSAIKSCNPEVVISAWCVAATPP